MWNLGSQVSKQLWAKTRSEIKLLGKVNERVVSKVAYLVRDKITNQIAVQLCARIKIQVHNQVKQNVKL
jgi:hypothetical protein